MNPDQFARLAAAGYNRIPVVREVLADLDTPLSTYLKLADGPYSYLFESVQGGEQWGRYSIIGLPCRTRLRVRGRTVALERDGLAPEVHEVDDPLAWIEAFAARSKVPQLDGLPRFTGGLVGYFGYDTVGYIEPRLAGDPGADPLDNPDILLLL
ncbi:MAG TPA: anthranilate synthase component I, partial [Gammaproteobacteria bacterium]